MTKNDQRLTLQDGPLNGDIVEASDLSDGWYHKDGAFYGPWDGFSTEIPWFYQGHTDAIKKAFPKLSD